MILQIGKHKMKQKMDYYGKYIEEKVHYDLYRNKNDIIWYGDGIMMQIY